jgi:hypothetical protein
MVNDLDGRASLEKWINQLWQKKDQKIKEILDK